ncbi:hypothetical protein AK812_SmicGene7640 [Symbiodinium microadriaticum]|uniref:Uncharacterized protein n=1 Tax=Symbiodinium microadriaticum TaxID=2951 RepID=A0A1Q9EN53_SYMMI|nr:hypothetical protein AK812_SmicGene7640 [Symbiodinium microadriaticum]
MVLLAHDPDDALLAHFVEGGSQRYSISRAGQEEEEEEEEEEQEQEQKQKQEQEQQEREGGSTVATAACTAALEVQRWCLADKPEPMEAGFVAAWGRRSAEGANNGAPGADNGAPGADNGNAAKLQRKAQLELKIKGFLESQKVQAWQ